MLDPFLALYAAVKDAEEAAPRRPAKRPVLQFNSSVCPRPNCGGTLRYRAGAMPRCTTCGREP